MEESKRLRPRGAADTEIRGGASASFDFAQDSPERSRGASARAGGGAPAPKDNGGLFTEVVEAEGHLIDSQILNVVFDTVVRRNASFDVLRFDIGRSNDEPSSIAMRISAPSQQTLTLLLEEIVALGCRLADQQDSLDRE